METIEVNIDYFKKCLKAISKDPARWSITGVYIHDDSDGYRHYVGTNGHVLVHCFEPTDDKPLEKGLIIKPLSTPKNKKKTLRNSFLKVIDGQNAIIENLDSSYTCHIIDAEYPNYKAVIPTNAKPQTEYVCFNPDYLKVMASILGSCTIRPEADDVTSPHLFKNACCGEVEGGVEVVLMPMRL